jgi:7-cyano-7-deazaguanine synthase
MQPPAVILLSGGLDSAVTLAMAREAGFELNALTFSYGQRHRRELEAAEKVARFLQVRRHLFLDLPFDRFGGSALTADWEVPKDRELKEIPTDIPITYVPARNTVFLSLALAWAEVLGAADIFIGVNALDYSGYPDCRPAFIEAFEQVARLGTRAGVEGRSFTIHTPLIRWTKAQIIRKGWELGVDFALTHTCYDPTGEGKACGRCDACRLRLKGFLEAGLVDPVPYALSD